MTPLQLIFLVTAVVTFASAVLVVTSPKLIHAGLWLVLSLAGVAVLFVLLEAAFLAVVQVLVYIGAIAILIIFAVMLTRRVMEDTGPQANQIWWLASVVALVLFAGLVGLLSQVPRFNVEPPPLTVEQGLLIEQQTTPLQQLGQALVDVNQYVLPFEVASILLLAAMIGAIVISLPLEGPWEEGGEA